MRTKQDNHNRNQHLHLAFMQLNRISQQTRKCLVLSSLKEFRKRPEIAPSWYRGYYTVARRFEFYFQVTKQYFTNVCCSLRARMRAKDPYIPYIIRTTRIWNLLITRLDLDNVTFENFKSVLYGYYSRALAINYDPDSPRSFKSICLKCNTARFLDQEISCCMWFEMLFYILLFFGSAVIGFSCCGVPAQMFKLLLVYFYVPITSVCISSEFFFSLYSSGQS